MTLNSYTDRTYIMQTKKYITLLLALALLSGGTTAYAADACAYGLQVAADGHNAAPDSVSTVDEKPLELSLDEMTPNQRRAIRGLSQPSVEIVPKGQWIFGGTASYSTHSNDSYSFLVIEGIESEGYSVKVSPLIAYAPRSNMAIGARVIYSRSLLKIDGGELNMGDINMGVDYYYALQHSYEVAAVWRQYIPLGQSKRFALFTECQLSMGGKQAKFAEGTPIKGTYQTGYSVSLGLNPGIVAFASNNVAFEVNIGVLGFNYSSAKQVHNQVTTGNRSTSYLNFKVNLLSIGVGMAFYL